MLCSTSMSCETNLLKENNELKREVKKLSNKIERCYNSKVNFDHMLKTQRNFSDKSGIDFNENNIKGRRLGKRRNEREMKKQEEKKLSHFVCFKCHEMGHLDKSCPTKKPKMGPQDEKKKPQEQVNINHENGDLGTKKKMKKSRRGGRVRHPMPYQDAKMISKNQKEKRDLAHIKCHACEELGHLASDCPSKLEKKAQANKEK